MTTKEKALWLCQKFGKETLFDKECNAGYTLPLSTAKRMALIAVDEIINSDENVYQKRIDRILFDNFWQQVKKEINNL